MMLKNRWVQDGAGGYSFYGVLSGRYLKDATSRRSVTEQLSVKCPSCAMEMTAMTLEGHVSMSVAIDVCPSCQAFWFDKYESLQLSPGSTLRLMKFIGEHSSGKSSLSDMLRC